MMNTMDDERAKAKIAMAIYSIPGIRRYVSDVRFQSDGGFSIILRPGMGMPLDMIVEMERRLKSINVRLDGIVPRTVPNVECVEDIPSTLLVFIGRLSDKR